MSPPALVPLAIRPRRKAKSWADSCSPTRKDGQHLVVASDGVTLTSGVFGAFESDPSSGGDGRVDVLCSVVATTCDCVSSEPELECCRDSLGVASCNISRSLLVKMLFFIHFLVFSFNRLPCASHKSPSDDLTLSFRR